MEAPKTYTEAGLFSLIAGVLNFITAGVWVLGFALLCVGFFWLIPMGVSVYQAWIGYQVYTGQRVDAAKNLGVIGLVTSILNFNIFAIVLSVLAMQKLKEPEAAGYLTTSG